MLGAFIAGVVLAIGHHLFCAYLDGTTTSVYTLSPGQYYLDDVGTGPLETHDRWLRQSENLAISTAFAYLVRLCLGTSIGIAFVELFWLDVSRSAIRMKTLDHLYAVLVNPLQLLRWQVWCRNGILALLGVLIWSLPLIVIFVPTSITVQSREQSQTYQQVVPDINWTQPNLYGNWAGLGSRSGGCAVRVGSALPLLQRMTNAVSAQGAILEVASSVPNTTYSQTIHGPGLTCGPPTLENITVSSITNYLQNANWSALTGTYYNYSADWFPYLAWVPDGVNGAPDPKTLYGMTPFESGTGDPVNGSIELIVFTDTTLLQCTLVNATYDVSFDFTGAADRPLQASRIGVQTLNVTNRVDDSSVTTDCNHIDGKFYQPGCHTSRSLPPSCRMSADRLTQLGMYMDRTMGSSTVAWRSKLILMSCSQVCRRVLIWLRSTTTRRREEGTRRT